MGRSCDQLPPSEALPGIGAHCVVYHNGKGYYYACKDYSASLDNRSMECVRPECEVTAHFGPGLGAPIVDYGDHNHPADLTYREKCILLDTIRQRFLKENSPAPLILQEILSSLPLLDSDDTSASCNFDSITVIEQSNDLTDVKEEPIDEPSDVEEHSLSDVKGRQCFEQLQIQNVCNYSEEDPSTSQTEPLQTEFFSIKTEDYEEESVDLTVSNDADEIEREDCVVYNVGQQKRISNNFYESAAFSNEQWQQPYQVRPVNSCLRRGAKVQPSFSGNTNVPQSGDVSSKHLEITLESLLMRNRSHYLLDQTRLNNSSKKSRSKRKNQMEPEENDEESETGQKKRPESAQGRGKLSARQLERKRQADRDRRAFRKAWFEQKAAELENSSS